MLTAIACLAVAAPEIVAMRGVGKCSSKKTYMAAAGCVPDICTVATADGVCSEEEAMMFRSIAVKGLGLGEDIGQPAAILELEQGVVSSGDAFIDYHKKAAMLARAGEFEQLTTRRELKAFKSYIARLRRFVWRYFATSLEEEALKVAAPIFFSRLRPGEATQPNDEYWHTHIDTEQYGTFAFTTLTYLSTQGKDFKGGSLTIDDDPVTPKLARVAAFTSGPEHPHNVEKVTAGVRYAVTVAFTCNGGVRVEDLFSRVTVSGDDDDEEADEEADEEL